MISLGNNSISEAYLGSSAITEAYLGEDLVYTRQLNGFHFSRKYARYVSVPAGSSVETLTIKMRSSEPWQVTTGTSSPWLSVNYDFGSQYPAGTYAVEISIDSGASYGDVTTLVFSSANYSYTVTVEVIQRLKSIWNADVRAELDFNTSDDLVWIFNGQIIATTGSTSLGAYGLPDEMDYRFFYYSNETSFYDVGRPRLNLSNAATPQIPMNTDIELEGGNCYLKVNGALKYTGTTQTDVPSATFCINTNSVKVYSLVAKKNGVTIASYVPGMWGGMPSLYNSVTDNWITLPDAQYETLT